MRAIVADPELLVRAAIAVLLAQHDIDVVADIGAATELTAATELHRPDVVVLGRGLPRCEALAEAAALRGAGQAQVVVLTGDADRATVLSTLRSGVAGVVLTSAPPDDLVAAVRAAAAGRRWLDPAVLGIVVEDVLSRPEDLIAPALVARRLTARELEVLALAAHGLTNADIAGRLFITEATTKTHMARVLTKLGLANRTQAVVAAYRSGLVTV